MKKMVLFIFILHFLAANLSGNEQELYRGECMSGHVFVVSEWLPKKNCEEELLNRFKELMAITKKSESGCIRAHATRQIVHPGAPGISKYKIILLQEYIDMHAFDVHCQASYVQNAFEQYVKNEETALVQDWTVRLFSEEAE